MKTLFRRLVNFRHNMIAHPIAGVLWLFGFEKIGDWVKSKKIIKVDYPDMTEDIIERIIKNSALLNSVSKKGRRLKLENIA